MNEKEIVGFAREQFIKAMDQLVSEQQLARSACVPVWKGVNSIYGDKILARLFINNGFDELPREAVSE